MKNRYSFRSRVSETKIREILRCFSADLTALQTAELTGANRNGIDRIRLGLRQRILVACEEQRPPLGVAEVDESLFGPRRLKGRCGRGAYGKTTVFGVFAGDGQVYARNRARLLKASATKNISWPVGPGDCASEQSHA